jgi:hypothetical protein
MAVTIVSTPNQFDNEAAWAVSSSLSEDASHVNLRVEANLYKEGVLLAKKVMPKGYTNYDFRNILNDQIKYKLPSLTDASGNTLIYSQTVGSNLLSSWGNDGGTPFGTLTTAGANITSLIGSSSGVIKACNSNTLTLTKGRLYVLILNGTVVSGTPAALSIKTLAGSQIASVPLSATPFPKKYYFMMVGTTATCQLRLELAMGVALNLANITCDLRLLSLTDWFVPYWMTFQEKYEDASGVTQSGTILNDGLTRFCCYFESNVATFSDYILSGPGKKFLFLPDTPAALISGGSLILDSNIPVGSGYTGYTRPVYFNIIKTPPSGMKSSNYIFGVCQEEYNFIFNLSKYSDVLAYVSATQVLGGIISTPMFALHIDESLVAATNYMAIRCLRYNEGSDLSEEIFFRALTPVYNDMINLFWKNQAGGFTSMQFVSNIEKGRQTEREYYKDSNNKNRPLNIIPHDFVRCSTKLHLSEYQNDILNDLLVSDLVYWQRGTGDLVEVTIKTDTITTSKPEELINISLEFEY